MKIDTNEYAILFAPYITEEGEFNGDVGVKIVFDPNNNWDDHTRYLLLEMITLVAATVPLLETDDAFLKTVQEMRTILLEEGSLAPILDNNGNEIKDTPLIKRVKNNVIHVDWSKKNEQ
tara:strand:+ start:97 stop:453 length:357 start_codon:yes stop_codon:yes gene_type:complete